MAESTERAARPRPAVLRRLWERMAALYHHRWSSALGDMPQSDDGALTVAGDTWSRGLAGITPDQIGLGIDACMTRSDPWPPTLPEFRALCLQVPSLDDTRLNVTTRHVTDAPFYRLVWQLLDTHRFRNSRAEDSDRVLRAAYEAARDHVMRLRPYPPAASGALPQPADAGPLVATMPADEAMRRAQEVLERPDTAEDVEDAQ